MTPAQQQEVVACIDAAVQPLRADIAQLKDAMATVKADVKELKSTVATKADQATLEAVKNTMAELKADVKELKSAATTLCVVISIVLTMAEGPKLLELVLKLLPK